ncbi:MAG: response regulator [Thermoanaerobaculia bacterium]|nr:response regulator [Thermoanaerobaculia bacterium]MBP9825688.1 response regulator [Thermoanaerobaculia bacterium]
MSNGHLHSWSYESLYALLEVASERLAPEDVASRFVTELGERLSLAGASVWLQREDGLGHPRQIASWTARGAAAPPRDLTKLTAVPAASQVWTSSDGREGLFALAAEGYLWLAGRTVGSIREIGEYSRLRLVFRRFADTLEWARVHARSVRRLDDVAASERRAVDQAGRLAALVGSLEGAVLVETADRRIALANASFCKLFGVPAPPEAMIGADCSHAAEGSKNLFQSPDLFIAGVERALENRQPVANEVLEMADGRIVERDFVPISLDGRPAGHAWHYREVTARVRAEREVARLKNFYEQVLGSMPVQLAVFDRELRYLHVTPSAIGDPATRQWIIGRTDREFCERRGLAPEIAEARVAVIREALDTGRSSTFEESFTDRTGELRHFVRFVHPVVDDTGQVVAALGYGLDITDRKRFEEQLTAANRAIEESARARERFLASISHEIRTPLNAVIGMTFLLDETALGAEQESYLAAIRFSADTLLSLINDVLDISKLEAGGVELESIPFRLDSLLRELASATRFDAERKGLALHLQVDPELELPLLGDPTRLRQVLINLVSNAVKFTDQGDIEIAARTLAPVEGRTPVQISVGDSGIGIAPEKRALIFEPFAQERADTARRFGGTGLGLAIVHQIVEHMGGSVTVGDRPGGGTIFTVEVALATAPPAALPAHAAVTSNPELELAGARLLLVEDNRVNQVVASRILRRFGATVEIVSSGEEALQRLAGEEFELVLMDVQMPGLDGYETTRRIRSDLGLAAAQLPVLALTASVLPEERRRAAAAGMNDFIAKPFDPQRIRQVIADHLAARGWHPRAVSGPPQVATNDAAAEAINWSRLEASAMGEPALVVELLDLFIEDAPDGATAIRAAGAAADARRLAAAAHALKASAGAVGAAGLQAALASLESLAPTLEAEAMAVAAEAAARRCLRVVAALREARPRYAARLGEAQGPRDPKGNGG